MSTIKVYADALWLLSLAPDGVYATLTGATQVLAMRADRPRIGQTKVSSDFFAYKYLLAFDTSPLGSTATISDVKMYLAVAAQNMGAITENVTIRKVNWAAIGDAFKGAAVNTVYGDPGVVDQNWQSISAAITLDTHLASPSLDATWINKTGKTYYKLSFDRAITEPAGAEYIELHDNTVQAYRPYLIITYTSGNTLTEEEEMFQWED